MFSNAVTDDGTLGSEADTGQFWVLFGGFAPLTKKAAVTDDAPASAKLKLSWYVNVFLSLNSIMLRYILACGSLQLI